MKSWTLLITWLLLLFVSPTTSQVNGGEGPWSPWVNITNCPATCGRAVFRIRRSTRLCNNPPPQNGGLECIGPMSKDEYKNCGFGPCPVDGGFTLWTPWSTPNCSAWTCGINRQGAALRTRSCTNPIPENGGRFCVGDVDQTASRPCNFSFCPGDGNWGNWLSWVDTCPRNITCGNIVSERSRRRSCDNPAPTPPGIFCVGESKEAETYRCPLPPCPVDGLWGAWTSWSGSSCSVTCGGGERRYTRRRFCDSPAPSNNGNSCPGPDQDVRTEDCNQNSCAIDGGFGPWSPWTDLGCNVTCGGGTKLFNRSRSCDRPPPEHGGRDCSGNVKETKTEVCTISPCPEY